MQDRIDPDAIWPSHIRVGQRRQPICIRITLAGPHKYTLRTVLLYHCIQTPVGLVYGGGEQEDGRRGGGEGGS
jgi:hypothetical protein